MNERGGGNEHETTTTTTIPYESMFVPIAISHPMRRLMGRPTTRLGQDALLSLWEVAAVGPVASVTVMTAWHAWHSRGCYDPLVCVSINKVAVEEVPDEVPVRLYLFGPITIRSSMCQLTCYGSQSDAV